MEIQLLIGQRRGRDTYKVPESSWYRARVRTTFKRLPEYRFREVRKSKGELEIMYLGGLDLSNPTRH